MASEFEQAFDKILRAIAPLNPSAKNFDAAKAFNEISKNLGVWFKELASVVGKTDLSEESLTGVVFGRLIAQGALSVVNMGSDFNDFAVGLTISRLLQPLEEAALTGPTSNWLKYFFRHNDVGVRMLIRAVEVPSLTDVDIIESAINAGIDNKGIRKILILKRAAEARELWTNWAQEDRAEEREFLDNFDFKLQEIDKEIQALEHEIRDIAGDDAELGIDLRLEDTREELQNIKRELVIVKRPTKEEEPKLLSINQIISLFKVGTFNEQATRRRLLELKIRTEDINALVSDATAEILDAEARAQAKAEKALSVEVELLSVGQIVGLFKRGIFNEATARAQLFELKLRKADIDALITDALAKIKERATREEEQRLKAKQAADKKGKRI